MENKQDYNKLVKESKSFMIVKLSNHDTDWMIVKNQKVTNYGYYNYQSRDLTMRSLINLCKLDECENVFIQNTNGGAAVAVMFRSKGIQARIRSKKYIEELWEEFS